MQNLLPYSCGRVRVVQTSTTILVVEQQRSNVDVRIGGLFFGCVGGHRFQKVTPSTSPFWLKTLQAAQVNSPTLLRFPPLSTLLRWWDRRSDRPDGVALL